MPYDEAAVFEKLAAATTPEEVKAALSEAGCSLKHEEPAEDKPEPEGKAPPFGKKKGENPFAKMREDAVAANMGGDDA